MKKFRKPFFFILKQKYIQVFFSVIVICYKQSGNGFCNRKDNNNCQNIFNEFRIHTEQVILLYKEEKEEEEDVIHRCLRNVQHLFSIFLNDYLFY